jgi:hypothetical protein
MNKLKPLASVALLAFLVACGGGGGSSSTAPTPTPTASTALSTETPTGNYSNSEKLVVFNQLNFDRLRCGFGATQQDLKLDVASQAHADYLAENKAQGHNEISGNLGFTGSSLADRISATGYSYVSGNEVAPAVVWGTWYASDAIPTGVVEVTARNVLRSTYSTVYHLVGLMSGNRESGIGVAISNNSGGGYTNFWKYLVIDSATPSGQAMQRIASDALVSFPCEGTAGLNPYFANEVPNPFPLVNLTQTPYGTPVYLMSATGSTLTVTSASITLRGGAAVPVVQLNVGNDPLPATSPIRLTANQAFIVPTTHLADNATYDVAIAGTNSGMVTAANPTGAFTKAFSFQTGTNTSD